MLSSNNFNFVQDPLPSKWWDQIAQTSREHPDWIVEWEIRFRPYFLPDEFSFPFDQRHMQQVLMRYGKYPRYEEMHTSQIKTDKGTARQRVINGKIETTLKRSWGRFEDHRYNMLGELSVEIPIDETVFRRSIGGKKQTEVTSYRTKLDLGDGYRLDITHVDDKYYYELETTDTDKYSYGPEKVRYVFYLIYGSKILYSMKEWRDVHVAMMKAFPRSNYPWGLLANARNLHMEDMTYYGLIGNVATAFSVTHKADGVRVVLIHYGNKLWIQTNPYYLSLIKILPPSDFIRGLSVFECEKISGAVKDIYLVYDTLAMAGISAMDISHPERIQLFSVWTSETKIGEYMNLEDGFAIREKHFRAFGDSDSFYRTMRQLQRQLDNGDLGYKTDGYIFMPSEIPYPSGRLSTRTTLHTDPVICKWKPPEQITIDFMVKDGHYQYQDKGRKWRVFAGTKSFPFYPEKITGHEGQIVEVAFDRDQAKIVRIRHDKHTPNHPDIIFDNWKMLHRPILLSTLLGEDIALMRAYHNSIKRYLYQNYSGSLLDLGSGRGGDISKWRNFSRIVALEPNPEHIEEFVRRYRNFHPTNSIHIVRSGQDIPDQLSDLTIIQTGAENYQLIRQVVSGHKFDVISSMLSLSLIPKTKHFYQMLTDLLTPTGTFLYLSIDIRAVNSFLPNNGDKLSGPWGYVEKISSDGLRINLEETIVSNQEEYPPSTLELDHILLDNYSFQHKNKYRADGEYFLSPDEKILTRMYVYAEISKR